MSLSCCRARSRRAGSMENASIGSNGTGVTSTAAFTFSDWPRYCLPRNICMGTLPVRADFHCRARSSVFPSSRALASSSGNRALIVDSSHPTAAAISTLLHWRRARRITRFTSISFFGRPIVTSHIRGRSLRFGSGGRPQPPRCMHPDVLPRTGRTGMAVLPAAARPLPGRGLQRLVRSRISWSSSNHNVR